MPHTIEWFLKDKIIHIIVEGDVTLDEAKSVSESIIMYINESNEPLVHVVMSEEKMTGLPKSVKAFNEVVGFLRHKQMGWFLIYGNTNRAVLAKFVATIVIEIAKVRHRRFETFDECLEFLKTVDSTLPSVDDMYTH